MAAPLLKTRKLVFLFATGTLLWTVFHAKILYWFGFPLPVAIVDALVSNFFLAGSCALIGNSLNYYLPSRQRFVYVFLLCVLATLIFFFSSRPILFLLLKDEPTYIPFYIQSIPIRISSAFLIIISMALFSVLWYTLRDQQQNEKRKSEAERLAKEAELYKLRQQLQPHFLFNSLNSINALITIKPQEARTMIQHLSDFLRGTLRKEENQWISLEDELSHLQLYLEIEKVRFGHRLTTEILTEEGICGKKLPAMLLQPIVENAIKFGLYDTTGMITIRMNARFRHGLLELKVTNPFDPETTLPKQGTGFGLSSVQRRLYLLFARNDLLQTEVDGALFSTTIKIPQI